MQMRTPKDFCTHCGRPICAKLGSPSCEEARKKFFETMDERINAFNKQRDGAAPSEGGKK